MHSTVYPCFIYFVSSVEGTISREDHVEAFLAGVKACSTLVDLRYILESAAVS